MKLLILGGTKFLGRHLVDVALARGHEVALFHRGETGAELFPELEHILGDRDGGLVPLEGREFDAVLDTSGYLPRVVRDSARLLANATSHYTFVSSISVYADHSKVGNTEAAEVGILEDVTLEDIVQNYGPLKGLCEKVVERELPGRTLVIRPGLIVGPNDPSDRFSYWVERMARGGEVLAPEDPEHAVQFIDSRDLAEWMIELAEEQTVGVIHATGPKEPYTLEHVLETCRAVSGSDAQPVWVKAEFLKEQGVGEWIDMPLWIHAASHAGHSRINISRALEAGLKFRPLEETVRDTLAWLRTRPAEQEWKAGLRADREAEVMNAWRASLAATDQPS